MKLLLLIGPLDKLLADKGLSWLTTAGNIALAFLMAHVAVKAVGKVAKTIANGRFKKVQDQPYFTHRVDTAVSLAVSISRYVFYFIAIAVSIGELGLAGAMNSMLAAAGIGTLALGIGAQSLIGDIVTGMFLLFEDQLSVGDYVSIGGIGHCRGNDAPHSHVAGLEGRKDHDPKRSGQDGGQLLPPGLPGGSGDEHSSGGER